MGRTGEAGISRSCPKVVIGHPVLIASLFFLASSSSCHSRNKCQKAACHLPQSRAAWGLARDWSSAIQDKNQHFLTFMPSMTGGGGFSDLSLRLIVFISGYSSLFTQRNQGLGAFANEAVGLLFA